MTNNKKLGLANAPIKKCIIAIDFCNEIDITDIDEIAKLLQSSYPVQEEIHKVGFSLSINKPDGDIESAPIHKSMKCGISFFNDDERQLQIDLQTKRLVYIDSRKYKSTGQNIKSLSEIWNALTEVHNIEKLQRVGYRVINYFEIPFDEFGVFKMPPYIHSSDNTQLLVGKYKASYDVRSELYSSGAVVHTDLQPINGGKDVAVTFDIDAFDENIEYIDLSTVSETICRLSQFKNDIFFANVEDANERFK